MEQAYFVCLEPSLELSEKVLEYKKIGLNVATTPDGLPFVLSLAVAGARERVCVRACASLCILERVCVCVSEWGVGLEGGLQENAIRQDYCRSLDDTSDDNVQNRNPRCRSGGQHCICV